MDLRPHRKLDVWNNAMGLVKEVYHVTEEFPGTEIYGLTSSKMLFGLSRSLDNKK